MLKAGKRVVAGGTKYKAITVMGGGRGGIERDVAGEGKLLALTVKFASSRRNGSLRKIGRSTSRVEVEVGMVTMWKERGRELEDEELQVVARWAGFQVSSGNFPAKINKRVKVVLLGKRV